MGLGRLAIDLTHALALEPLRVVADTHAAGRAVDVELDRYVDESRRPTQILAGEV